jgi:hypothetical protein
MDFKFELKDDVMDSITGFNGTIIARVQYLTGYNSYHIQPTNEGQENKKLDAEWMDEDRLKKLP